MKKDENCLFCQIIHRQIDADICGENEYSLAFKDIQPVAPIHFLVVPKRHVRDIVSLEDGETFLSMMSLIDDIMQGQDCRIVANKGVGGGQTIFHCHLHVLAGKTLSWPPL